MLKLNQHQKKKNENLPTWCREIVILIVIVIPKILLISIVIV